MENIQNTKEARVNLVILGGFNGESVDFTPPSGRVVGCVIFHNIQPSETAFIEAKILDNAGVEISKLQHIDNYRSRDAEYLKGCKPLFIDTQGRTFTFEIQASQAVDNDFKAQLIFIYADERQNCNI